MVGDLRRKLNESKPDHADCVKMLEGDLESDPRRSANMERAGQGGWIEYSLDPCSPMRVIESTGAIQIFFDNSGNYRGFQMHID